MNYRTRFAPSPTGYLHIGGVRTALFNWLVTRRHGGKFILRIDDTDAERNRAEALQPILDGFRWLGMTWDEGPEVDGPYMPYYQSQRNDKYAAAAMRLLEAGNAYPDYMTKDDLDADRKAAEVAKRAYVHRGPHRDTPAAECVRLYQEKPTTLRFKVPLGEKSVVEDLICGHCEQLTDLMGDPVILRADGRALYNFATVVDDIDLQISHVIRAREHLSNTYTQVLFFQALGGPMPAFGHVPVVNEPKSKKKLSKRDMAKFVTEDVREKLRAVGHTDAEIDQRDDLNPATVAFYRELGYLPAALVNYLGRLGWSLDGEREYIPLPEMIEHFSLDRVNDSAASFDPDKLYWLAGEYMKELPFPEKCAGCVPFLQRAGMISTPPTTTELARLEAIVTVMGERLKLFSDILIYAAPFLRESITYDAKAKEKAFKKVGAVENLTALLSRLGTVEPFDAPTLEKMCYDFCTERGIKFGDVQLPIRVSVTGTDKGVGLFETLELLGRDVTIARLSIAIAN